MDPSTNTSGVPVKCPCNNCKGHLEFEPEHAGHTVQCPHCGLDTLLFIPQLVALPPIIAAPPPIAAPFPPHMIASQGVHDIDQVFFSSGPLLVTKTRLVAFGEAFAMSGVISVRAIKIALSTDNLPILPILIGVVGVLICLATLALGLGDKFDSDIIKWFVAGISLIVAAVVILVRMKPKFAAVITTAAGETRYVLVSKDKDCVLTFVESINQAIIARG